MKCKLLSHVWLFATPWTILQSMESSRSEYWNGQPFPSPGNLPNPGMEPRSPAFQVNYLPAEPSGKSKNTGVGSLSLLQQIFSTQELNWGLLHRRGILHQLSYQGSPIKERVDFNNTTNRLIRVVLSFLIMTHHVVFPFILDPCMKDSFSSFSS